MDTENSEGRIVVRDDCSSTQLEYGHHLVASVRSSKAASKNKLVGKVSGGLEGSLLSGL